MYSINEMLQLCRETIDVAIKECLQQSFRLTGILGNRVLLAGPDVLCLNQTFGSQDLQSARNK